MHGNFRMQQYCLEIANLTFKSIWLVMREAGLCDKTHQCQQRPSNASLRGYIAF